MNRVYKDEAEFINLQIRDSALETGDYENCKFKNCDFSNSDLSDINFLECEFHECNLSLARLTRTLFREVKFITCKMLGLHFEECNKTTITFSFDGCTLDLSSFYKLKLKRTIFSNSKICEADFTETDLNSAIFDNCNLQRTVFKNTGLEGADFRTSYNYSIDPLENRIRKAKFSLSGIAGLLDKYDIEIEKNWI
jgi:fluoroquinolone resistance protein